MEATVPLAIIVDDEHMDEIDEVAKNLEQNGLSIELIVPEAGAIRAQGDPKDLGSIRSIEGVETAEPERKIVLPPSDSKIPQ